LVNDFYINRKRGRHRADCKQCNLEDQKKRRKADPNWNKRTREYKQNNKEHLYQKEKIRKQNMVLLELPDNFTRKCTKCKIEKHKTEFWKTRDNKTGLQSRCIQCAKQYTKDNKETIKKYKKEYNKKNKQAKQEYDRKYIEKNRDKIIKRAKQYRKANPGKHSEYAKRRSKYDLNFKLRTSLRGRIYPAISSDVKTGSSIDLIGCSIDQFKLYLESQFKSKMTWENWSHSGWHIDHIIPLAKFDLTDPMQQKLAFNYKNTQPLWAKDNLSKNKYISDEEYHKQIEILKREIND
jgi:hypothetical protein